MILKPGGPDPLPLKPTQGGPKKPRPINDPHSGIGGTWDEAGPHTGGPEPF